MAGRCATFADSHSLFRGGWSRLHSGGDCLHSAVCTVSRPSHVCVDGRNFSNDALERRGQPVFASMAATHAYGLGTSLAGRRCTSRRPVLSSALAGSAGGARFWISAADQRRTADSIEIRHGDAISNRTARAGYNLLPPEFPGETADNEVEWAWAMKMQASVLGSVLAMVIWPSDLA